MQKRAKHFGLTLIILTIVAMFVSPLSPAAIADEVADGNALYKQRCAQCHGEDGKANTAIAKALKPAPRNHADGNYMNLLSNEHLTKVIKEGGTAVGKSAMMPPQADLTDHQIKTLIAFMRTIANPPYKSK